jgi:hypothetical protein
MLLLKSPARVVITDVIKLVCSTLYDLGTELVRVLDAAHTKPLR